MSFSIRPFCRFPICCPLTYHAGPFLKLRLASCLGFWCLIALLALSSSPAHAEWMSLGESESGTTVHADPATMGREGDLVKMEVLFDFKTIQTKAGISYLSAKAHMEYDCANQRFEGHAVMYFSDNMGRGTLRDRSSSKGKWLPVSPNSLDHALWKLACGKK